MALSTRKITDSSLFNTTDPQLWEAAYQDTINPKYKKGTRNCRIKPPTTKFHDAPIYLVPRERGTSYKDIPLFDSAGKQVKPDDVFYAPVSKGYGMQDLSSFTVGPIVGEGLCLVNTAFSKAIGIMHVEGGGKWSDKRKNFWIRNKKPKYQIHRVTSDTMSVDSVVVNIHEWLDSHKDEWYPEWLKWHDSVALCGDGNFHWIDDWETLAYYHPSVPRSITSEYVPGSLLNFQQWKTQTYLKFSMDLMPSIPDFQRLQDLRQRGVVLGLVHPKAKSTSETPMNRDELQAFLYGPHDMCCQPYIVAYMLLKD